MTTTTNSLKKLCLEVIVSNFGSYFKLYCVTEDSCLKLKFEFLKKKFSFQILQDLYKENCLKAEYLHFLINKYLKVFDLRWLRHCPLDTISQKLVEIGHNLEEVNFIDLGIPWEEVLCYLPNLKRVSFEYFCTNEFLLSLSKFCKYVEMLNVKRSCDVSDEGFMHLDCKNDDKNLYSFHASIKELSIQFTKVGDKGIAYILKNMPSLVKINYRELPEVLYSIHKYDINAFDKIKPYNLTHLNLLFIDHNVDLLTNIFTVCTSVCPHLKSLYCLILQKHHLDLCSQWQELEKLHLDCWKKDSLKLDELLTLIGKKLTSLKIHNFCVSLSVLAQNCSQLNLLEMRNVNLQHDINDSVPVFHNLEKIIIEKFSLLNPVITQAVTCLLSSAPNCYHLCFRRCMVSPPDIKIQILNCCEQCKLNIIDFRKSDVEFVFVRDILLTCSTLRTLNLNRCDVMLGNGPMHELQTIATSLPNQPQICVDDIFDDDFDDGYINPDDKFDYFHDYNLVTTDADYERGYINYEGRYNYYDDGAFDAYWNANDDNDLSDDDDSDVDYDDVDFMDYSSFM